MGSAFLNYASTVKLRELARDPIDLSQPDVLTPERVNTYAVQAAGLNFLYATERVTVPVMTALAELAEESGALEKMERMQAGDVVNFIAGYASEKRPALHTACRDLFDAHRKEPAAAEAAALAKQEVAKLTRFIERLEQEKQFTDLIVIGIGGSDLGPRAHYQALLYLLQPERSVHFIANVDPDDASQVLSLVPDLKKTLVAVISKSGTTLETAVNEKMVRSWFEKAGLDSRSHFVAVTTPRTPMDDPDRYREVFHLWDWVGGRFSTTSMCGGLPLAFAFGISIWMDFLEGAHEMDRLALESSIKTNLPLLAALLSIWNRNFLGYATQAIIPYSQALARYPAHIQQVEMESNGKRVEQSGSFVDFETGPIIWGEPGTNAQHSFFQLLHQGTTRVPLCMIGFRYSQRGEDLEMGGTSSQEKLLANLFAQAIALAAGQKNENPNRFFPGNCPSHLILAERLNPRTLGKILSFFEHKVAFQGFIWGINSFDQEGVQLGKLLAARILTCFENPLHSTYPLGEAYIDQLHM